MKVYEIPVYKSQTTLKELDPCGTIYCYKTIIGAVREITTNEVIPILEGSILETIGRKKYIKDKSTFYNYYHNKTLKSEGIVFYILQRDYNRVKEVSKEDVKQYIENFEQKPYNLFRKEGIKNLKHKNILLNRK